MRTYYVLLVFLVVAGARAVDAKDVPERVTLSTDTGEIVFLVATSDNRYLVAASLDSYVYVWETSNWRLRAKVKPEPPRKAAHGKHQDEFSAIHGLAVSPDNHTVAFASDGRLYTYDVLSQKKQARGQTEAEALAFTPDTAQLLASSSDGHLESWNTKSWRMHIVSGVPRDSSTTSGAIAVSRDKKFVVVAGDGGVGVLSLDTLKTQMLPLPPDTLQPATGGFQLAISGNGRLVASGLSSRGNRNLVVWDMNKESTAFSVPVSKDIWAVAFSPTDDRLFTGAPDGEIEAWETQTWKRACSLGHLSAYQFAMGDRWLAAGGGERTVTIIPLSECENDSASLSDPQPSFRSTDFFP